MLTFLCMAQVQHHQVGDAAVLSKGEAHGRLGCRLLLCISPAICSINVTIYLAVDMAINTSIRYISCRE